MLCIIVSYKKPSTLNTFQLWLTAQTPLSFLFCVCVYLIISRCHAIPEDIAIYIQSGTERNASDTLVLTRDVQYLSHVMKWHQCWSANLKVTKCTVDSLDANLVASIVCAMIIMIIVLEQTKVVIKKSQNLEAKRQLQTPKIHTCKGQGKQQKIWLNEAINEYNLQ